MRHFHWIILFLTGLFAAATGCRSGAPKNGSDYSNVLQRESGDRPRLLITTDIGGDPDDTQSLIRLLVTSSEFDIEGLVASASGTPGELDTAVVRTDLIKRLVRQYEKVHSNLTLHYPGFPDPSDLVEVIKGGNPTRGLEAIGPHGHTEGSRLIAERILVPDSRPLNVCIFGGQTDLHQALWHLKDSLPPGSFSHAVSNLRIYSIDDQDGLYQAIRNDYPGLFHILAKSPPGRDKREGVYRGMYLGGDESISSPDWVNDHVKLNHGPLGALYPMETWTAPNPHGCLKEGDTPSWLYFLENGLQDPSHPQFGGWGGRFMRDSGNYYIDAEDHLDSIQSARATVWRWRPAFQNEFAARMDWCVRSYREANHPPVAVVAGDSSGQILRLNFREGNSIEVDAGGSYDPDGDAVGYTWWIYSEPGGMEGVASGEISREAAVHLSPEDLAGFGEIHLILEVTDEGTPPLTSYRRIIVVNEG